MKRINACASDAQLSFDLSNSLLTPSFHNSHLRNKFKLTPIAVACVCALCSLSANAATPSFPNNNLQYVTGEITLDSDTIKKTLNELPETDKQKQDLVGFFNDDTYWQEGSEGRPGQYITTNNTRINIELNEDLLQPHQKEEFLIQNRKWPEGEPSSDEDWNKEYHGYFTINASNNNLTIQYDFKQDGRDDNGNPRSTHTTALSFFENAMMSDKNNTDLKYFVFTPTVNLITKNQLINTDNQNKGDGRSSLGLSLSNKKRNITFKEEVNFISDFSFFGQGSDREQSGVNGLSIASGIYNVFGAANYAQINEITKDYISEYGKINFEKFATVSVTHSVRDDYPEKDMANPEYNEVFGVFNNEGATTNFLNGANIVVKGHNKDGIVAALASASTLGVLDPYKQGTISVKASEDNTVSRIWALSVAYDSENADASPFSDTEEYIQDQDILSSQDVKNEWNKYINNTENMEGGKLRFAALSMHGSNIEISDENRSGYFDIRGDVMAGMLNGEGTKSNTFMNNTEENASYEGSQLSGTVQHASITINLTNAQSKLYGNIYERHRFGEEESAHLTAKNDKVTAQSDSDWRAEQKILEQNPEAGKVDLTLNNGATWMPQQKWFGWNYDFVHPDFYDTYNEFQETGTLTESAYENFDLSDQYNLKVWNEETEKYEEKNITNKNTDAVNDSALITDNNSYFDKIDKTGFTTVDNGIYHLALNDGGVVDTRYMRQDFNFSTVNDVIGNNMDYSQLDKGIKKLRIQELAGNGGTFNIFVENKKNHDLIIIDQAKENSSPTISFNIWNGENNKDKNLGITKGDESTFVQIGRVGKDIQFNKTIEIGPQYGDIQSVTYTIEEDKDNAWTTEQHLEYQEQMKNLFITGFEEGPSNDIIEGARISSSLAYNYAIMDIDRLQKRRGEARYITQQDDGMWARYRHINSGLSGNDDSADVIQIGYDHKVRNEESYNVYSVAVDYLRGQSDFDQSGDSEMNRYSLAVYDTWLLDNGAYLDLTARVGYFDAEMNTYFRMPSNTFYNVDGNYNFWGASVGAEIGRKFSNKDQWFFEPQTQLTYTYIGGYDFNTSQGVKVESDSIDSVIMRWGLRVGKDFGTSAQDGLYSVYLMADALHDFLGQQELTVTGMSTGNSHVAKFDGEQTWYDVGIGFSCTLNENSYIFLNYERSLGHDIDNTWEANAGVSVVF